jgi:hypothetical protein
MSKLIFLWGFGLEKNLRLTINRLSIILIISMVFLSIQQQKFPFKNNLPVTCSESLTVTSPKMYFSTFLGGEDGTDKGEGITIADDGSCYVTGLTWASDFPTHNAYDSTYNGESEAFISKFDSSGLLVYSTFFGGNDSDYGHDVIVSDDGSYYVVGLTESYDFPTKNAYDDTYNGGNCDVFVTKFAANGTLLWSSYLGGDNNDIGNSIAVANDGSCYVTGITESNDFPTLNAYNYTRGEGSDTFVTKFNASGSLLWSTYFGGNGMDHGRDIAVASDGSCYVTGMTWSTNFPILNAYDDTYNGGNCDVFVSKFNASGTLQWSTYLGGSSVNEGSGITVTSDGSCYVTGVTTSNDFPTQDAYNDTKGGSGDAFLTKFDTNGSLLWSTFLGGNNGDYGYDVTISGDESCYVIGQTYSNNFPTKNAYNGSLSGGGDAFIAKFAADGLLLWSTYVGGSETEWGLDIAVTKKGECYITGKTWSVDFPTKDAYDDTSDGSDAFVTKFIDPPIPPTNPLTVTGFLVFIAVMLSAVVPVIALIVYKKQK